MTQTCQKTTVIGEIQSYGVVTMRNNLLLLKTHSHASLYPPPFHYAIEFVRIIIINCPTNVPLSLHSGSFEMVTAFQFFSKHKSQASLDYQDRKLVLSLLVHPTVVISGLCQGGHAMVGKRCNCIWR